MYPEEVIVEPLLTEKSNGLKELRQFVFRVSQRANKVQIKRALADLYKVEVLSCNVVNIKGKKKRQGRAVGRTNAWKKAIVTLKEGSVIPFFEGS